jgi:hypothetical protein
MIQPWGLIDWAFQLSSPKKWDYIGCLGPEERSIASLKNLADRKLLQQALLLKVEEPNSPYARKSEIALNERQKDLASLAFRPRVVPLQLLAPISELEALCNSIVEPCVILDITSLPKRFFFYLLKCFYQRDSIRNLIMTYTLPASYPQAQLAENHDIWDALPTFRHPDPAAEAKAHRRLLVNIGFIPDGLVAHLENRADEKQIDLILPFPGSAQAVQRAWQSLWALTSTPYRARFNEHRVGAHDLSGAFDLILSLLPHDTNLVSFAPFGPKPISAAMCLYSSLTGSPVYYAQPKIYRPDYSIGVAKVSGVDQVLSYWLKCNGRQMFKLPLDRIGLNR